MIAVERIQQIEEVLKEKGFVEVEQLAAMLGVSAMTVRRDLDKMCKSGIVERCHGGAILRNNIKTESMYVAKKLVSKKAKTKIAAKALELIQDNSFILLDAGTTSYELATMLVARSDLTVLTNDLRIASLLAESSNEVILLGGIVQHETHSILGSMTSNALDNFRVDITFVGTSSVDGDFNSLTPTLEKVDLKRNMMRIAQETYLLADNSKFYKSSLYKICSLSAFTGVISDRKFSDSEKLLLEEKKIHIISCEEEHP